MPLINTGVVNAAGTDFNVVQSYTVYVRNVSAQGYAWNASSGGQVFYKPADNIGNKSIPDYTAYASQFTYELGIPGCATPGRVFVGQRKEGFVATWVRYST